jgi:glycosyltransferase involved in cell wall biosynthesis
MKIAVLGILAQKVSKDALGGTEIFTANLVNELNLRGHSVTLFATKDSQVNAKVEGELNSDYFCQKDKPNTVVRRAITSQVGMYADFLLHQDEFDFVHVSVAEWFAFLPFTKLLRIPHCVTVHNKLLNNADLEILFNKYPETNLVFAQNSQQNGFPKHKNSFVVQHGININDYNYSENAEDYLSWLGRLVAGKGLENLPKLQKNIAKTIKIGGSNEKSEFFLEQIKPYLDDEKLIFLGPQDLQGKNTLFGRSRAFLNPRIMNPTGGVAGLVVIEANACGTPVLGFDSEGMREVIKNNVNGFLVEPGNFKSLCEKINELYEMDSETYKEFRRSSRKYAEDNFSVTKMVDGYESLYSALKEDFNAKN